MYLLAELDPDNAPKYLVVRVLHTTGARLIEHIVSDINEAERLARMCGGYVLEIDNVADYR